MKQCTKCGEVKNRFPKRSKSSDGLSSWCTDCFSKNATEKYAFSQEERERKKNNRNRLVNKSRDYVYEYLLSHPCIMCGETNPIVLEFDHRNPDEKDGNVSELFKFSLEKVKAEIAKCDVLCANCHRIKTAQQFDTWKNSWV